MVTGTPTGILDVVQKVPAPAERGVRLLRRLLRPAARALRQHQYRHLIDAAFEPQLRSIAYVEVAERRNYDVGSDQTGQFAELRLYPGQRTIHRGVRSEFSLDYRCDEGDTVEYSWMLRLPSGFNGHQACGRWWMLAQWHDQPDPTKGEDWSSFPARESPIQILYRQNAASHQLLLMYGAPVPLLVGSVEIPDNQWIQIRAVIHWSRSRDGQIELHLGSDSKFPIVAKGPNMLNGYFHFLKVGTYRDPAIQTYSRIHIRGIAAKNL